MKSKKSFFHGHEGFVFVAMAMVIAPAALAVQVYAQTGVAPFSSLSSPLPTSKPSVDISLATSTSITQSVRAGFDGWVPVSAYTLKNTSGVVIDVTSLKIEQPYKNGDNADFTVVGVRLGGLLLAQNTLASSGPRNINFQEHPITLSPGASVTVTLVAKTANVNPSSTVGNVWKNVARSGHAPTLSLIGVNTQDEQPNIGKNKNPTKLPNSVILRKAIPSVKKLALANEALVNNDQDLYKFQVSSDVIGSIAWKQMIWNVSLAQGISLENFRMRRGATDLDAQMYGISARCTDVPTKQVPRPTVKKWINVMTGSTKDRTCDRVLFQFKSSQEEVISGPGNVYTLHATVKGANQGSGQTVSFNPLKLPSKIVTGYLLPTGAYGDYRIKSSNPLQSPQTVEAGFIWSDNSEVPHSAALSGGSPDWSDGSYINMEVSEQQLYTLAY